MCSTRKYSICRVDLLRVLTPQEAAAKRDTRSDPLREDGSALAFAARLKRRRIPIAAALLDKKQSPLGNIYQAELLFHHRINPMTPARELSESTVKQLWDTAVWWLELGVRSNRIITVLNDAPKRLPRLARRRLFTFMENRIARLQTLSHVERSVIARCMCATNAKLGPAEGDAFEPKDRLTDPL